MPGVTTSARPARPRSASQRWPAPGPGVVTSLTTKFRFEGLVIPGHVSDLGFYPRSAIHDAQVGNSQSALFASLDSCAKILIKPARGSGPRRYARPRTTGTA